MCIYMFVWLDRGTFFKYVFITGQDCEPWTKEGLSSTPVHSFLEEYCFSGRAEYSLFLLILG